MSFNLADLGAREWLVVAATIAGPVLAVQAQKWIELLRERRNRKLWLFQQLMATRASRLSTEHVQALNMIDLMFYGRRIIRFHYQTRTERAVLAAWREYHDHLNTKADDAMRVVWTSSAEELFIKLLSAIADDVRFKFDRVQLKKGWYSPVAHGELEAELLAIRKMLVQLLSGDRALKMDVASLPVDPDALQAQIALNKSLSAALTGQGALNVKVKQDGVPAPKTASL
jgi:hypothetical protein